MRPEQVKVGAISNKAFLLLVVDTIKAIEELPKRDPKAFNIIADDIGIVSETQVEAFCCVSAETHSFSMKHKVSFTYEHNCVDIRIFMLGMELDGKSISRSDLNNPHTKSFVDDILCGFVHNYKTALLEQTQNISTYENISSSFTDDSIWDGTLFNALPSLWEKADGGIDMSELESDEVDHTYFCNQQCEEPVNVGAIENVIQLPFNKVVRLKSLLLSNRTYIYLSPKGYFNDITGVLVGEMSIDGNALVYTDNTGGSDREVRISNNAGKIVIAHCNGQIKLEDSYIVEAIIGVNDIGTSKEIFTTNSRRIIQKGIVALQDN